MAEIIPVTKDQLFEKKIAENTGSNYNVGDISDVVPVTKDQSLLKEIALNSAGQSEDITELEGKVTANSEAIEATQDMISDAYDSTHTYNVGDYCIYENALYKCKTANTTGAWDASKWDGLTIADSLKTNASDIATNSSAISNIINHFGDYMFVSGEHTDFDTAPFGMCIVAAESSSDLSNAPTSAAAAFLVLTLGVRNTDFIIQIAFSYFPDNKVYTRFSWAGWSSWQQISN